MENQPTEPIIYNVLYIDDDISILKTLNRVLRRPGFQLTEVNEPRKAVELIKEQHFDIIISDLKMPEIDGAQILEYAFHRQPDCIRILLTGHEDSKDFARAVNSARIFGYIQKPWKNEDVNHLIQDALDKIAAIKERNDLNKKLHIVNRKLRIKGKFLYEQNKIDSIELAQATTVLAMAQAQKEDIQTNTIKVLAQLTAVRVGASKSFVNNLVLAAELMSASFELSDQETDDLIHAAMLYQIGKIGFADALVLKPEEELSKEQERQYHHYPQLGADLLMPIAGMQQTAQIILTHRENINGSGWPQKLTQDDIPFSAQILRVIIAYFEWVDDRQNQHQLTTEDALERLEQYSDKYFNSDLIEPFKKVLSQIGLGVLTLDKSLLLDDIEEQMLLSRDLISETGILLLSKGSVLTKELIQKLEAYQLSKNEKLMLHVLQ